MTGEEIPMKDEPARLCAQASRRCGGCITYREALTVVASSPIGGDRAVQLTTVGRVRVALSCQARRRCRGRRQQAPGACTKMYFRITYFWSTDFVAQI